MTTPDALVIEVDSVKAEVFASHAWVYTGGDRPVVGYLTVEKRWTPFLAEYDATTKRQVAHLSADDAASRCGVAVSVIRQIERAANAQHEAAAGERSRRNEDGRRSWAEMSREERQALNDYAMKTEGHSID